MKSTTRKKRFKGLCLAVAIAAVVVLIEHSEGSPEE